MPRQPKLDAPGTLHHVMGREIKRTNNPLEGYGSGGFPFSTDKAMPGKFSCGLFGATA